MPADKPTQTAEAAEELASQVRSIIERNKANPTNERLKRVRGRYLFDVEGVGAWRIIVNEGKLEVLEGPGEADCVVHTNARDFLSIAAGEQNLVTAFMQGRVRIEGDMALAQKLNGIIPASPRSRENRGGAA